jgi:hypothetical protein
MNEQTKTSEYLLLFRDSGWEKGLSLDQLQTAMDQFAAWFEELSREGKLKAGQPLEREGRVVSARNGRVIADGPFAESKEAIGGYLLLTVNDLEEAVAIAKRCPMVQYSLEVEVRPIADECPKFRQLKEQLAHAVA